MEKVSKSAKSADGDGRSNRQTSGKGNRLKWFKIVAVSMGVAFALLSLMVLLGPENKEFSNVRRFLSAVTSRNNIKDHENGQKLYAIMMDAGSTGSRILVFTFNKSPTDGSLKLVNEFYKEIKPGISSYHENPQQAADTIRGLFNDAKGLIPVDRWPSTTASLKATAGLRLLPGHKAENLLNAIREVFLTSGFRTSSDSVEIIDGVSEGLYSWTTINFLLDKLNSNNLSDTVAVLDMGGGSMQLSLVPIDPLTSSSAASEDLVNINLIGQPVQFYIHSYLGMGLMAVRLALLQRSNRNTKESELIFLSPFISAETEWEFQGKKFRIRPHQSTAEQRYFKCREEMAKIIRENGVSPIVELKRRNLFAISYFYDRASDAQLIKFDTGGFTTVDNFCSSAGKACEVKVPNTTHPFDCIDLTYLCVLLEDGLGLQPQQIVNLKKKIDGHETSWALGAALSDLDRQAKENK
ncbi:hypothetical protein CHUAL_009512 [Chamberlinius hualienensis]